MNFTLIIIAAVVVIIGLIVFSIWLNKKGITKDDNDNYIPDVLEDKVKNLIKKDPELPAEDKEKALALLHQDTVEMQEVSKRWQADMKSDSWLSKNTRPLTLVFLTVAMVLLIFIDSTGLDFEVDGGWVDLLKSLLITVYVAYFGSRGAEKFKTIQKN